SDLNKPNGTDCDDGSACTTSDTCQAGSCVGGPPLGCDDGNPCTTDGCNTGTGCTHINNTVACTDGLPRNGPARRNGGTVTCQGGSCSGTPKACDDGQFCDGAEECDFATGDCVTVPGSRPSCDDGAVCTTDSCDASANDATGACVNALVAHCCTSDAQCDDGL